MEGMIVAVGLAGVVVAILVPGTVPSGRDRLDPAVDVMFDGISPRKHLSYLVKVERGGKRKPALYWPRAESLRKVAS